MPVKLAAKQDGFITGLIDRMIRQAIAAPIMIYQPGLVFVVPADGGQFIPSAWCSYLLRCSYLAPLLVSCSAQEGSFE